MVADKVYRNAKIYSVALDGRKHMRRRLPSRTANSHTLETKQVLKHG